MPTANEEPIAVIEVRQSMSSFFLYIFFCLFYDSFVRRCLEGVLQLHKEIKEDEYLIPYAIVEIALLYIDEGRIDNAIAALEDAK